MAIRAESRRELAFDAGPMERFWTLENDFLAALAHTEVDLSVRRNRLLMSAVLFGGLLNPDRWGHWLEAWMGPLRGLAQGERLEARQIRAVFVRPTGSMWFADPITESLLGRPVVNTDLGGRLQDSDYTRLARLPEGDLIGELESWVLPAAKIKMTLLWPPLVIEHCAGALRSKSLGEKQWNQLNQCGLDMTSLAPLADLETLRRQPRKREPKAYKPYRLKDRGFHYIRTAIVEAIQTYAVSDDPTLALERVALIEMLSKSQEFRAENTLGWWVHQWFLKHCPNKPHPEVAKRRNKRASTFYDHVFTLGLKVDWSDLWDEPLSAISPQAVERKLHEVVRYKPEGLGVAKQLSSFLGFGTLSWPAELVAAQRESNIKSQILSGPQFQVVLGQIHDKMGNRGAHWLAAMLMFRCGLRTREIVAMEIDNITLVDGMVELKVAATPYVALKNRTSARVLPLHALLSADELTELLKWRGQRVRDSGRNRRLARLLFETIYDPSDYDYLFDPIEAAIRRACDLSAPASDKPRSAAYIFSRCSALRHSFVSYAVATMLFMRDDGGFPWPVGITPDLVSLGRRERLERALLAEGHLGLSSLEAVRQLTGHASFKRTLGTYTHIMDLIAGAYCWRRSSEPSLSAEVVCELSAGALGPETLSRYARRQHEDEQKAFDAAAEALRSGHEAVQLLPPRERRPRGRRFPSWMPHGNAFLSQIRTKPVAAVSHDTADLPEWRTDDVTDWYNLDQIVQMVSRAIPASVIADEFGVRREVIERLARRYHQLISVRRRTTKNAIGKHRHRLIFEEEGEPVGPFDAKNGCWYAPIKRLPKGRQHQTDRIWVELQRRRQGAAHLEGMRNFLRRHQDGRVQAKSRKSLDAISGGLRGLLSGVKVWPHDVVIKHFKPPTNKKGIYQFSLKFESEVPKRGPLRPERWPATTVMLHLLLLAEAASPDELPDDLVATPVVTGHVDVGAKILAHATEKLRKAREEARAENEAKRKVDEDKRAREKAKRREMYAKHARGEKTFEEEIRGPRTRHGKGGTPRR